MIYSSPTRIHLSKLSLPLNCGILWSMELDISNMDHLGIFMNQSLAISLGEPWFYLVLKKISQRGIPTEFHRRAKYTVGKYHRYEFRIIILVKDAGS